MECRRMAVNEAAGRYEPSTRRSGMITKQTQGVEKHFREGADVDDATGAVQCLQSSNGMTSVAVLRVVIVFNNPCVRVRSQVKEFQEEFFGGRVSEPELAIITINGWNRLAITFRMVPGEYQPGKESKVRIGHC